MLTDNERDARRYQALRAYSQTAREWLDTDHPEHRPGDTWDRPYFGPGVVLCLAGEDLDRACDMYDVDASHDPSIP